MVAGWDLRCMRWLVSGVHAQLTALSVGPGYNSTSDQQKWLQRDLAAVNRTQTPW